MGERRRAEPANGDLPPAEIVSRRRRCAAAGLLRARRQLRSDPGTAVALPRPLRLHNGVWLDAGGRGPGLLPAGGRHARSGARGRDNPPRCQGRKCPRRNGHETTASAGLRLRQLLPRRRLY